MERIVSRLATAALLAGAAACATVPRLTPELFAKITAGKTTLNQVRELLGPPSQLQRSPAHRGEQWGYRYAGTFERRMFWIEFSPDGVVRETSDSFDFDADRRYRGA